MRETCQQYVDRRLSEGWKITGQFGHSVYLSPPDGSFIRPVDLRNDVETLRPNAAGDEESISQENPISEAHYTLVDEETPDEGDTCVYTTNASYERDLYNLPASSGSGTINFIKIHFRCSAASGPGACYAKPSLKSDSTVTDGTEVAITTSWVTYSEQWNTNPADSQAWEWDDIDNLQIGVSLKSGYERSTRCTQVYVEVDYTPGAEELVKVANETISISDSLIKIAGIVKALAETVGITESTIRRLRSIKPISETIGVGDDLLRRARSIRLSSETISISDSLTRRLKANRFISETIGIAETLLRRSGFVKIASETISLTDSMLRTAGFIKILSETIGLTDSLIRRGYSIRQIEETISLPESILRRSRAIRYLTESVYISDAIERRMRSIRLISEVIDIADSAVRSLAEAIERIITAISYFHKRSADSVFHKRSADQVFHKKEADQRFD